MSAVTQCTNVALPSFLSGVSARVVAWLTVIATVVTVVGGMTMLDDRYARAEDVKQTQAQIVKAIKIINVDLELSSLRTKKLELKTERRMLIKQTQDQPNNELLKELLFEVNSDLSTVKDRMGQLKNSKLTQ